MCPDLKLILCGILPMMCSADLICVNGSTIHLVLCELLLRINLWAFQKKKKKKKQTDIYTNSRNLVIYLSLLFIQNISPFLNG